MKWIRTEQSKLLIRLPSVFRRKLVVEMPKFARSLGLENHLQGFGVRGLSIGVNFPAGTSAFTFSRSDNPRPPGEKSAHISRSHESIACSVSQAVSALFSSGGSSAMAFLITSSVMLQFSPSRRLRQAQMAPLN